jgi:glucokinase
MKKYAIGVDIGGSHICSALIDMERKFIVPESFSDLKVDNQASANSIMGIWTDALKKTLSGIRMDELVGIGFAMPGPFDYEKGIALFERVAKYESLYNLNVVEYLRKSLGLGNNIPVRFMNDATSFAVGEAWIGKSAGFHKSIALTLGTGFGSAFIENGVPVLERDDVPQLGCVWHLPYKDGIADDYFSTRWYIKEYAGKTGKTLHGVKEISDAAKTDPNAKELFVQFGDNLGKFLGPWMKKFRAEVLVIGGNMAGAYELFGTPFENSLNAQKIRTPVHLSEHKENAALIGSARLLEPEFWEKVKFLLSKM